MFGIAAIASAVLHPLYGRLADRWGPRRLTLLGLAVSGCVIPALGGVVSFESAIPIFVVQIAGAVAGDCAVARLHGRSHVGRRPRIIRGRLRLLTNVAWGVGLLAGPAAGGFLFERIGLARLATWLGPGADRRHAAAGASKENQTRAPPLISLNVVTEHRALGWLRRCVWRAPRALDRYAVAQRGQNSRYGPHNGLTNRRLKIELKIQIESINLQSSIYDLNCQELVSTAPRSPA